VTERDREPQRLSESDASVRQLLDSARGDNPSGAALRAAPVAITSLLAAHASAATATATASAASAAGFATGGAKSSAVGTLLVGKWLGLGLLAGAALTVGASAMLPAPERETAPKIKVGPTIQAHVPSRAKTTPFPGAASSVASLPVPTASVVQPTQSSRLEPARSESKADLARELALLDATAQALDQHDAARALGLLDAGTALPSRALLPEATLLRLRALLQLHRHDDAARLVEEFARSAPRSPQLRVLRGLLQTAKIP